MMTAKSIGAALANGYADYLESRTVAPEQGDYYLGRDGAPAEAPGRLADRSRGAGSCRRRAGDGGVG